MKIKHIVFYTLIFVALTAFAFVALRGATAHAASIFDDTITLTDRLIIKNGTHSKDISSDWMNEVTDKCNNTNAITSLQNRENLSITYIENSSTNTVARIAWYATQSDASFRSFSPTTRILEPYLGKNIQRQGQATGMIDLYLNSNGTVVCSTTFTSNTGAETIGSIATNSTNPRVMLFISDLTINYPQDYEGPLVPGTYVPPVEFYPVISYSLMSITQTLRANVTNTLMLQNTDNANYFPNVSYKLYHNDSLLKEEILTQSQEFTYKFDTLPNGQYLLVAQYTYENGGQRPEDIFKPVNVLFTYNGKDIIGTSDDADTCSTGPAGRTCSTTDTDVFVNCLINGFPFIDVPRCVLNVKAIINLLSFNSITGFTNNTWTTTGCGKIGNIADWLNLPHETPLESITNTGPRSVCPKFPAAIRSIINPFISFALGLLTFKILIIFNRTGQGQKV